MRECESLRLGSWDLLFKFANSILYRKFKYTFISIINLYKYFKNNHLNVCDDGPQKNMCAMI